MNDPVLNKAVSTLSEASPEKPWMTANYIARRIQGEVEGHQVEQKLLAHCKVAVNENKTPLVRYSSLPSRRTLEVLWGAITNVGNRSLESITNDHLADESLSEFVTLKEADVFMSHSHLDYTAVMAVAKYLLQNDVVPWLAETHIEQGKHIHEEIISALDTSQYFLLYLSPNALDSRWTGKEYYYAVNRGVPIIIVADIDFEAVRELVDVMTDPNNTNRFPAHNFNSVSPDFMCSLIEDDENIIQVFTYSRNLRDRMLPRNVRPFTELPGYIQSQSD